MDFKALKKIVLKLEATKGSNLRKLGFSEFAINEVKKRHRQRAKRIRNYIKVINKVESIIN